MLNAISACVLVVNSRAQQDQKASRFDTFEGAARAGWFVFIRNIHPVMTSSHFHTQLHSLIQPTGCDRPVADQRDACRPGRQPDCFFAAAVPERPRHHRAHYRCIAQQYRGRRDCLARASIPLIRRRVTHVYTQLNSNMTLLKHLAFCSCSFCT